MIGSTGGGASEPSDTLLAGKAGGAVAVRRTLASTICRMTIPTQATRPRQLRDASTVMRFQPAHQSMINRRLDGRASCPARKSPEQALARKPRIHSPASGKGGQCTLLTLSTRAPPLHPGESWNPFLRCIAFQAVAPYRSSRSVFAERWARLSPGCEAEQKRGKYRRPRKWPKSCRNSDSLRID